VLCKGAACHKFLELARLLHGSYFRAISTNHGKGQTGGQEERAFREEEEKRRNELKGGRKKDEEAPDHEGPQGCLGGPKGSGRGAAPG